jgi:UPF0042 nucleotide-binding protein
MRYDSAMRIVLITGISGSGKSVALHVLEDAGYFCVDNLPPSLAVRPGANPHQGRRQHAGRGHRCAQRRFPGHAAHRRRALRADGHDVKVFFLTASDETLITRFSETRRSHPLSHRLLPGRNPADRLTLTECIALEKEMLGDLQDIGLVMDTSQLSSNKLRRWIKDLVDLQRSPLTLLIESFGFKHGCRWMPTWCSMCACCPIRTTTPSCVR